MFRAQYPFKKTHPTSLSFNQGDIFVELAGASTDKNWHYVLATTGEAGYVPKNYVISESMAVEAVNTHLDTLRDKVRLRKLPEKEKAELLSNLEGSRRRLASANESNANASSLIASPSVSTVSVSPKSSNSDRSISPSSKPGSSKKRTAPKPPPSSASSANQHTIEAQINSIDLTDSGEPSEPVPELPPKGIKPPPQNHLGSDKPQRRLSVADPTPEQVKRHARDLVELVRIQTGLSHDNSQAAVHTVLQYVCTNLHRLDRNVPAILTELETPVLCDISESDIASSADTIVMERLFEQLTQCKEDDQQRNWMLYEDEQSISNLLLHLSDCLTNSDKRVSCYVVAKFKYFYVHNLIEYFQMETRWSLRKLLIENFMLMCSIDPVIISVMLSSVLPLELAQDLFQYVDNSDRLRNCALLLTIVFSRGEPMPIHYFEQLGANFVNYMLDVIESPNSDISLDVIDAFVGLALSYNLQFPDVKSNVLIACLASRPNAKMWTEKILLLLNREEDPCVLFMTEYKESTEHEKAMAHSVQKAVIDMFTHPTCHKMFYTNDIYVLIDIIVRQLADLGQENPARHVYVRMCQLVLKHADYSEHLHRFRDLEIIFIRILDDDEESPHDKAIIEDICKEVPAFHSLAP